MPTRFDSAMPTLKKRSGNFLAKKSVRVELCTSPSTTTMSGCCAPASASASPNASRVDLPSLRSSPCSLAAVMAISSSAACGFAIRSDTDDLQRLGLLLLGQRLAVVVGVLGEDRLDRPALD